MRVDVSIEPVPTAVVGVAEKKDAAAGLMGVIAVADQQYAVTVVNRICLAHLEDVVGPFGLFGQRKPPQTGQP